MYRNMCMHTYLYVDHENPLEAALMSTGDELESS